ncbi:hypothetical protein AAC387_Pa03g3571 [Persea americana]
MLAPHLHPAHLPPVSLSLPFSLSLILSLLSPCRSPSLCSLPNPAPAPCLSLSFSLIAVPLLVWKFRGEQVSILFGPEFSNGERERWMERERGRGKGRSWVASRERKRAKQKEREKGERWAYDGGVRQA